MLFSLFTPVTYYNKLLGLHRSTPCLTTLQFEDKHYNKIYEGDLMKSYSKQLQAVYPNVSRYGVTDYSVAPYQTLELFLTPFLTVSRKAVTTTYTLPQRRRCCLSYAYLLLGSYRSRTHIAVLLRCYKAGCIQSLFHSQSESFCWTL